MDTTYPKARTKKLLTQTVGDELVIYDQETQRAHRLNPTAALIWQHCNGHRTVTDLAEQARQGLNAPALTEDVVWLALDRLKSANLLQTDLENIAQDRLVSRRSLIGRGTLASVLLPVVATILAPTPAMAASCALAGENCDSISCCSGLNCIHPGGGAGVCV